MSMRRLEVTLEQIKKAIKDSVVHGSAGFHDTPNQRLAVQYSTKIRTPEDLARIIVAHRNGAPIYLGQGESTMKHQPCCV